jgi:hypothetical protein
MRAERATVAEPTPVSTAKKDATGGGAGGEAAKHTALLEVRSEMSIEVDDSQRATSLARTLEELATLNGGYVETSSSTGGDHGETHVVLRVPPAQLASVRAALSSGMKEGTALQESTTARDVTDSIADLDARLHTAREEETRLLSLLREKTGSLSDVLAVERALSDVRERIERMDTEHRLAQGRVDLATVDVWLRTHAIEQEGPLGVRIVSAARDGLATARDATIGAFMVLLRAGPTLALFGALAYGIFRVVMRVRRTRVLPS